MPHAPETSASFVALGFFYSSQRFFQQLAHPIIRRQGQIDAIVRPVI
jgi:hypothetical protein